MERVFTANHPDPLEIDKAKKVLKVRKWTIFWFNFLLKFPLTLLEVIKLNYMVLQEHEQALIDAIGRLADISDGESGRISPPPHPNFFNLAPFYCSKLALPQFGYVEMAWPPSVLLKWKGYIWWFPARCGNLKFLCLWDFLRALESDLMKEKQAWTSNATGRKSNLF